MIRTAARLTAIAGASVLLVACGRSEPEPVVFAPAPAPIYTKDGRVIDQPRVTNQNTVCSNGITREEDLQDGDIDCSS